TPSSRIDAVKDASASSSNSFRGWKLLGLTVPMGSSTSALPPAFATSVGISAPNPLPRPRRCTGAHLLGQFAVGQSPPRGRIEHNDRLPERRRFREANGPGNDVSAHSFREMLADVVGDLFGQLGA